MELILHIGDMKTGSSSIQATLETNRALLREAGYFYPPCGKYENHVLLTLPALSRVPRQFAHVDTRETLLTRAERHWAKIAAAVGKHAPEKVILSAENLLGLRASEVPAFLQLVQRHVPGITSTTAICYLRRNSSHYTSRLQQRIKASSLLPPLQPNSYAPKLAQWADQVDRLVVREMARDTLTGGDVVPDFLHTALGEAQPAGLVAERRNETISAEGMLVLRRFRRTALPDKDGLFDPMSTQVLRIIRAVEAEKGEALALTKPRLKEECRLFLDSDSEDLQLVRDRYGLDLCDPAARAEAPAFDPEQPLDRMIDIDPDKALRLYGEVLAQLALEARKDRAQLRVKATPKG
ncbi:MAG: hypothetical protein ACPH5G_00185 [Pseudooceanicola atlanticus]